VLSEPFQIRFPKLRRRRSPDIIFIAKQHLSNLRETYLEGPPDLIVEIVSWESQSRDRRDKYLEYQAAGVRELTSSRTGGLVAVLDAGVRIRISRRRRAAFAAAVRHVCGSA